MPGESMRAAEHATKTGKNIVAVNKVSPGGEMKAILGEQFFGLSKKNCG